MKSAFGANLTQVRREIESIFSRYNSIKILSIVRAARQGGHIRRIVMVTTTVTITAIAAAAATIGNRNFTMTAKWNGQTRVFGVNHVGVRLNGPAP